MTASDDALLGEQIRYYRLRAGEYDEWFLRQGRYDHGADENARWRVEAAQVATALDAFLTSLADRRDAHRGQPLAALELAGGTGLWTQRLAPRCGPLTVVDAAPETLAINRERLGERAGRIEYQVADLFTWRPQRRYDLVFFSFWLSHVPPERLAGFWAMVRISLAPGGRAFLIDSRYTPNSTALDHHLEGPDATTMTRRLNDGSEHRVVKVYYTPERLNDALAALGWRANIQATPSFFLYGQATPDDSDDSDDPGG